VRDNLRWQLERRLGLIIINHLDEAGLAAYTKLAVDNVQPATKDLERLLKQYFPDYQATIKSELAPFIEELLAGFVSH
jgi:hypothetical protein